MKLIREDIEDKTYRMSDYLLWSAKRRFPSYKPTIVDLDTVIRDARLLKDNSVLNRRSHIWGDSYDKYKIDEFRLDNNSSDPIRIELVNGKYRMIDGAHRIIALKNSGYTKAEVLVLEN